MELSTILQIVSSIGGSGAFLVVLYLVSTGKLVPGSTHDEMREDRNFYRKKFHESTNILGTLLSAVEVEDEHAEGGAT